MSKKLTQKEFEIKANKVHNNKYSYGEYKDNKTKINIFCKNHNFWFKQRPDAHIYQKQGCPICNPNHKKYTKEKVVKMCNDIHNNFYKYPDNYQKMNNIWNIECPLHGIFPQKVSNHIYLKHGCPKCNNTSIGEKQIRFFLKKNNIKFEEQKRFNGCKDIKLLPFDFYLFNYNLCIEYDGIQHFNEKSKFYSKKLIEHDKIKNEFCKNNNIKLLRIKYNEKIEIIKNILKIYDINKRNKNNNNS